MEARRQIRDANSENRNEEPSAHRATVYPVIMVKYGKLKLVASGHISIFCGTLILLSAILFVI